MASTSRNSSEAGFDQNETIKKLKIGQMDVIKSEQQQYEGEEPNPDNRPSGS
jgi:hypothetical protein